MPTDRPPNLILLVTDQQRAPAALADRPGVAGRADAQRRRAAADGDVLPARLRRVVDVLAEPRQHPHRHLPGEPRRAADADGGGPVPGSAQLPRGGCEPPCRLLLSGEVSRGRVAAHVRPRAAAPGPQERQRARAAARHRHAGHAAARARLPRRAQGQVASDQAGQRRALDRGRRRAAGARLRLRRLGPQRRGRRRQGRVVRRRHGRDQRRGLGRGLHAPDGGVARPGGPARAVLPGVVPGQPARRARLPGLV